MSVLTLYNRYFIDLFSKPRLATEINLLWIEHATVELVKSIRGTVKIQQTRQIPNVVRSIIVFLKLNYSLFISKLICEGELWWSLPILYDSLCVLVMLS